VVVASSHEAPATIGNWVRAVIGLRLPIKTKVFWIPNEPVTVVAVREQSEI